MSKLCGVILFVLLVSSVTGCASYQEPGYTRQQSSSYAGKYSRSNRDEDQNRNYTISERQQQYDRHQDNLQRRSFANSRENWRNITAGLAIIGAGYVGYSILKDYHVED